jgi:alcohol dehydrogenase/propanol-preferring alcohol dehydrogenase
MGGEIEISLASMIFVPRSVMGTQTGNVQDLRDVIALAESGKLKPIPIERLAADEANTALQRLKDGKATGRLVLEHTDA